MQQSKRRLGTGSLTNRGSTKGYGAGKTIAIIVCNNSLLVGLCCPGPFQPCICHITLMWSPHLLESGEQWEQ